MVGRLRTDGSGRLWPSGGPGCNSARRPVKKPGGWKGSGSVCWRSPGVSVKKREIVDVYNVTE